MDIGKNLLGSDWNDYKDVMSDAHATFNQKVIKWSHFPITLNRYQEDNNTQPVVTDLLGLLNYNYRRGWPVNKTSDSGEEDEQSIQILFNKEYLKTNNLINPDGYFPYDVSNDIFTIDGINYKSFGDTEAAQMRDDDVFITIIVKRIKPDTGA